MWTTLWISLLPMPIASRPATHRPARCALALSIAQAMTVLLAASAAQAQTAAAETWALQASLASPWGSPVGTAPAAGQTLRLGPNTMLGPAPLQCPGARHEFIRLPAEGLFEGGLPAAAASAARALGLPTEGGTVRLVTQRIGCRNGSFDLHLDGQGRAWLGLDNRVLQWQRSHAGASPEATVQALLVQHLAGDMALNAAAVQAKSAWLSPALAGRLLRWLAQPQPADEVPDLNGDPFTDSQEPPESFTLAPARVQGDSAEVRVQFRGAGPQGAARPWRLRLLLQRVQGEWRVDDLLLRDGQRLSRLIAR